MSNGRRETKAVAAKKGAPRAGRRPRSAKADPGRPDADLDGLTDHLGYLIRRAQLWIFEDFTRTLAAVDIGPAQYSVLTVINANPGLTQMAVSHALGIERARLVYLLDGLEARQLVKRRASATDRRSHALHLTPEGRSAFMRITALAREHERRLAEKVGLDHHKMLVRLMQVFANG